MSGILSMLSGGTYSSAPANTVAPVVSGTATVGQTLSSTTGTWTGAPTPTFTYQWQRAGSNISSATSSTYTLVNADAANTIRCVVTATNVVSAVSANSNSTASVAATVPEAPTIGTATATAYNTATVVYTAPASNGGATITSYTATSSPSGITGTLNQAGSGTITVSGLAGSTNYTFTVTATNSAGTSAASSASNSISTPAAPPTTIGQAYGGGFYAGKIAVGGGGTATHYLVVSDRSAGQVTGKQFGPNPATTGFTSTIAGPTNSAGLAALGTAYETATFCENLSSGGYTDWYLPAKDELEVLFYYLKPSTETNFTSSGSNSYAVSPEPISTNYTSDAPPQTGASAFQIGNAQQLGVSPNNYLYFGSSTELNSSQNSQQYFQYATNNWNGYQFGSNKNDFGQYTRAIRRVAV